MTSPPDDAPPPPRRRPPRDLSGRERKHLRGLAHHETAIVQVGKEGVTTAVRRQVAQALDDHELIKVRVGDGCAEDRGAVAEDLARALGAHLAGSVGNVLILYRQHPNKPKVPLR